jgi:DNA-binding NarL/FixJ family response regulator
MCRVDSNSTGQGGRFRVKTGNTVTTVDRRQRTVLGGMESELLVFCDKATGTAQFRSASPLDQAGSVERAAGLLAIQCLVRGYDPDNFVVMVPAEATLSDRLLSRARELLKEGREISCPVALSPRQKEILGSIVRSLSNKEIASRLNISVRTVKFHVSSLLEKFGVESRGALAQKAAPMLGMQVPMEAANYSDVALEYAGFGPEPTSIAAPSPSRAEPQAPAIRFSRLSA